MPEPGEDIKEELEQKVKTERNLRLEDRRKRKVEKADAAKQARRWIMIYLDTACINIKRGRN